MDLFFVPLVLGTVYVYVMSFYIKVSKNKSYLIYFVAEYHSTPCKDYRKLDFPYLLLKQIKYNSGGKQNYLTLKLR